MPFSFFIPLSILYLSYFYIQLFFSSLFLMIYTLLDLSFCLCSFVMFVSLSPISHVSLSLTYLFSLSHLSPSVLYLSSLALRFSLIIHFSFSLGASHSSCLTFSSIVSHTRFFAGWSFCELGMWCWSFTTDFYLTTTTGRMDIGYCFNKSKWSFTKLLKIILPQCFAHLKIISWSSYNHPMIM
jgi:hypothetical protein